MTEAGEGFYRGDKPGNHRNYERAESDQVIANTTPDQQAKHCAEQGEKEYLVGCHKSASAPPLTPALSPREGVVNNRNEWDFASTHSPWSVRVSLFVKSDCFTPMDTDSGKMRYLIVNVPFEPK